MAVMAVSTAVTTTAPARVGGAREVVTTTITTTVTEIDRHVYELYGLSEEEIKVVEGK